MFISILIFLKWNYNMVDLIKNINCFCMSFYFYKFIIVIKYKYDFLK